jgi:O-antigen ligase
VLVFVALVAAVPLTSLPYGSVEPWWIGLFEAAIFLLAALWAIEGVLSGSWFVAEQRILLPALCLAAFAYAQTLTLFGTSPASYDPYETRLASVKILALTTYAGLLLRYADTERRLRALVYACIATALASALFGIGRQASQRGEGFLLAYLSPGVGYAQFINKNHFAYLAEMGLGLILGLVAGRGVGRGRWLAHLGLALPVWAGLVLCNSRGGLLAMLCQFVFLGATFGLARGGRAARGGALVQSARRRALSAAVRVGLLVLLLCALIVGMVWVGGDPLAERMASVRDEVGAETVDPARGRRAEIWASTWEMFEESPLAGTGLGAYWIAVSRHHKGSGEAVPYQAHNDYLELLASGGLLGAGLVALFVYLFVGRARARLRAGTAFARAAALGALTGLFGVAVHSLFEFGLHVTSNAVLFAALVALASAGVESGADSQKTSPKAY